MNGEILEKIYEIHKHVRVIFYPMHVRITSHQSESRSAHVSSYYSKSLTFGSVHVSYDTCLESPQQPNAC